MRLLIIEDHIALATALKHHFNGQGHGVTLVHDGEMGCQFLIQEQFDICILDINLPILSGLNVLARARNADIKTPILVLTARDEIQHRIEGLDAGADDYLAKPFEMAELDARLRALLRRSPQTAPRVTIIGSLTVQKEHRQVLFQGEDILLTRKEFAALECLSDTPGSLVPKTKLIEFVYGVGEDVSDTNIEVLISRLRKKLASYAVDVKTARGLGYFIKAND